jgi:hypothetical protein
MANMSYCRFQNTESDLRDCQRALDENGLDGLSDEERDAAEHIIRMCREINDDYGDLVDGA